MNDLNSARFSAFETAYRKGLAKAVAEYPSDYADDVKTDSDAVAEKIVLAVGRGSYNHDGRGFKNACKSLGIKHTRTAIEAFLKGA